MKDFQGIPAIARLLGFDASQEPQYLWIARLASEHVIDPSEWKEFTNEKGQIVYYNVKLKAWFAFNYKLSSFRNYKQFIQPYPSFRKSTSDKEVSIQACSRDRMTMKFPLSRTDLTS
jgi:hypothetical protein